MRCCFVAVGKSNGSPTLFRFFELSDESGRVGGSGNLAGLVVRGSGGSSGSGRFDEFEGYHGQADVANIMGIALSRTLWRL